MSRAAAAERFRQFGREMAEIGAQIDLPDILRGVKVPVHAGHRGYARLVSSSATRACGSLTMAACMRTIAATRLSELATR